MDIKDKVVQLTDENLNQIQSLIHRKIEIWSTYVLYSDLWWLGVGLSVAPWILWFIFRAKRSTDRLLYVGASVGLISLVLDVIGDQIGLWHYRFNVIPVLPTYAPWDVTLMPVTVMFLLQIKPNGNPIVKAVLFALLTSYVGEPFFHWLQIYNPLEWRYSYSVPIQILIYLTAHYISKRDQFSKFGLNKS